MRNNRIYLNISELNLLFLAASVFAVGLVVIRVLYTQSPVYITLIWNLFLAWIPYIISYKVHQKRTQKMRKMYLLFLFMAWLIFYPNAPYIVTDLFHLNERGGMPLWFDLILISTFAAIGMILALVSLKDTHHILTRHISLKRAWQIVVVSLLLSGFGVYIGRYLRWNSWDVLWQSKELMNDMLHIIKRPYENMGVYAFTLFFSLFQIVIYLGFYRFVNVLQKNKGYL